MSEFSKSGIERDGLFLRLAQSLKKQAKSSDSFSSSDKTEVREIYPTVTLPRGRKHCTVYLLKEHTFSKSSTYQGKYNPPSKCGTKVHFFIKYG